MTRPGRGEGAEPDGGRLWTGEFATAVVVNALVMVVFYLLMTTMALYAAERFSASDSLAGLASSMFIIGAVLARLVAGPLIGRLGPRRILVWSLVVFVAMSLAYLVAVDLVLLLAVRLVHGIAFGLANTAVTTIAQSIIPRHRRGEGTGYFSLSVPFAGAVGPLAGLALIDAWGYEALFVGSLVASGAAYVVALALPDSAVEPRRASVGVRWRAFIDRDALPLAAIMLAVGVVNSSVITFAHPFTAAAGLGGHAGMFFAVNALGVLASRLLAGLVQDRFGENWVMYPALLAYGGGLAALSQAQSVSQLVVAAALIGLGFGSVMPTVQAATVNLAQPHNMGLAVATFYLLLDVGTGIGPLLLGALVGAWDYRVMYLAATAVVLIVGVHYTLVHGQRAGRVGRS